MRESRFEFRDSSRFPCHCEVFEFVLKRYVRMNRARFNSNTAAPDESPVSFRRIFIGADKQRHPAMFHIFQSALPCASLVQLRADHERIICHRVNKFIPFHRAPNIEGGARRIGREQYKSVIGNPHSTLLRNDFLSKIPAQYPDGRAAAFECA